MTVERLPFGLKGVVAPTFLGFALINGFTFALDLAVLSALYAGIGLPLPVAVTSAYVCAFAVSYALNRVANFASHAPVGPQVAVYVVVVGLNYLVFILGVTSALTAVGADFRVSRILAGCGEALFMYSAMRWVVFRPANASDTGVDPR